jgi:membrane-associated phospholipid phosphatase
MMSRTPTLLPRTPVKIEIEQSSPQTHLPASTASVARSLGHVMPYDSRPRPRPLWARAAPWLVVFLVCCAWDRAVWLMVSREATLKAAAHSDIQAIGDAATALAYAAVYHFGRLWLWIGLGVFFTFRHWGGTDGAKVREGMRRGVFVFLVPALAGLAAEALKLITRRERPETDDGTYAFLGWPKLSPLDPAFWTTEHLSLASSHTSVAIGGALAAGLLLPKWRVPLLVMAALCTISRVAVGAHYVSDVFAGAAIALGAFKLVYAWDRRNNGGVAIVPAYA